MTVIKVGINKSMVRIFDLCHLHSLLNLCLHTDGHWSSGRRHIHSDRLSVLVLLFNESNRPRLTGKMWQQLQTTSN